MKRNLKGQFISEELKGNQFAKGNKPNKTSFKKREHPSPKTEWKKGDKRISGKNHWAWKGGITPLINQIRNHYKSRQWRSDVFTRDDFICQECGTRGGDLEAHHIKKFVKILEEYKIKTLEQALNCKELWNINNGWTLCLKCHLKIDNYGKKDV